MPDWLGEVKKSSQKIWYASDYKDECGDHALIIWEIAGRDYLRLNYSDGTEFMVDRAGTEIWADWPEDLTLQDIVIYLLGPVLGILLSIRGAICLHASAVAVGDQAVALVGPTGAGKSTTAAALAQLGYPVLTEDVVTLSESAGGLLVQPAYPLLRLWPSSVEALFGEANALPRLTPTWDKRFLALEDEYTFEGRALPLAALYFLGQRSDDTTAPLIEEVQASTGLIGLVGNSYAAKLLDTQMRAREFEVLGRVASRVPMMQVTPHADIKRLPELCHAILADVQTIIPSAPIFAGTRQR